MNIIGLLTGGLALIVALWLGLWGVKHATASA
jgi:hypothetical protein